MPEPTDRDSPRGSPGRPGPRRSSVGLVALVVFGWDLASEPFFADESAYYSQSYFAGTFASGRFNDPAWLDYPAYDLPPLPKYLIGAALWLGGYTTPGPGRGAGLVHVNTLARFDPPGALAAARVPMVVVGAIGCLAVYGIGVLAGGAAVGLLAALLLMANPLYRLHARRAMSDVPVRGVHAARRCSSASWPGAASSRAGRGRRRPRRWSSRGFARGWRCSSKLSGTARPDGPGGLGRAGGRARRASRAQEGRRRGARRWSSAAVALVVFVALDPFLTAHPAGVLARRSRRSIG